MWQKGGDSDGEEQFEIVRENFYRMTSHTFQTECKGKKQSTGSILVVGLT